MTSNVEGRGMANDQVDTREMIKMLQQRMNDM